MRSLKDTTVVITGASRGIGAALARAFAAEGARLVLNARTGKTLKDTAASLDLPKTHLATVTADISRAAGVRKVIDTAYRKFGVVDTFINNAGCGMHGPIDEASEADYNRVFDTNLRSVFLSMQQLIPRLKEQGHGQIINISSMAGRQGVPGLGLYSASKGAVDLLSQAAAAEVRNDGIKICCVSPGSTNTGFMPSRSSKPGLHRRAKHRLHIDEVAELVVFVARQNERAWSFMTDIRPLVIK